MAEQPTFEIVDGVRRAKAAWLCGRETIMARSDAGPVFSVSVSQLRSPHKEEIDVAAIGGLRWQRVLRVMRAGLSLPPIEVVPGTRGRTVQDVEVAPDEFDLFR